MINRKERGIIGGLILTALLVHLSLLNEYSLNLPFKDDYRVFINYLYYFFHQNESVFLPDNESHPVLMRLITLAQYSVDGHLDFRHILWFCNLSILLMVGVLSAHFYGRKEYWNIAFVFLLVLNGMLQELYFRTDVGTYQTLSFALSLFLFYGAVYYSRLSRLTRLLFYAAFMLTPFGSVNGMLANVMVVLCFLVNRENRKALLLTSVILVAQFLFMALFLGGEGKSFNVWENISKYNFQLLYAYFLSVGGILNVISSSASWAPLAVAGAGIFGYTFYRLFFPFRPRLNFEQLLFVFCAGSLALIVVLRYNYWIGGYVSVLESRYKIYGALILLLFFSVLVRHFGRFSWLRPVAGAFLAVLFAAGLYKGVAKLKVQRMEQIAKAFNVDQDVYEHSYAQIFYITKERKEYLEDRGVYSFAPIRKVVENILTEENRLLDVTRVSIGEAKGDPLSDGDWNSAIFPMRRLEVEGIFPRKGYYFIRFRGEGGKSSLHFLDPPPFSRLRGARPSTVRLLSCDFYPQPLVGIDFNEYEVYGVDDLGL